MGPFKPMRSETGCTRTRLDEDDDHGPEWCPFRCYKLLAFSFDTGRNGKSALFERLDTCVDEKEFKDFAADELTRVSTDLPFSKTNPPFLTFY